MIRCSRRPLATAMILVPMQLKLTQGGFSCWCVAAFPQAEQDSVVLAELEQYKERLLGPFPPPFGKNLKHDGC